MPIECSNGVSEFDCEQWRWPKLLRLAQAHGWQPRGTTLPGDADGQWDRNYTTNDGQEVTADDAAALADALEKALSKVPEHDALAPYRAPDGMIEIAPRHPDAADADWFSGPAGIAYVARFIRFCREGTFHIW